MFEFQWENMWNLVKINDKSIDDLLDSEEEAVIGGMCDVLKIVKEYWDQEKLEDTKLQDSIRKHIERETLNCIPEWLLERL